MQCCELYTEHLCIAARTQFQMFQYQIALFICSVVRDRARHVYRAGRGNCFQSRRFGNEHSVVPRIVELEKIAQAIRSFQLVRCIDAATTDGCRIAHLEPAMRRIADCSRDLGDELGIHDFEKSVVHERHRKITAKTGMSFTFVLFVNFVDP